MYKDQVLSAWGVLILAAAFAISCGSSGHLLQSLTINPATADAKNYPNGQVKFTAMGSYGGSSQAFAVNALWWNFTPWTTLPQAAIPLPGYTLSSNGLAACVGTGTFTVWATAPRDQTLLLSQMTQSTSQLTATAQLTCP